MLGAGLPRAFFAQYARGHFLLHFFVNLLRFFKENDMYYNYYSNVSSFSYFTTDGSSKLIQSAFSDGTQIKSFDYEMSGNQNLALVSNFSIKAKNNYSFYFLADYDVDYINYLFSDNIGIDCETVLFKEDIQFVLS